LRRFFGFGEGKFSDFVFALGGANNDPDVFDLVFSSKRMPPNGANRGHYKNARVDQLIDGIRTEMDREKRKELCSDVQKILAEDGPYLPLCLRMWGKWSCRRRVGMSFWGDEEKSSTVE
jgi:ABC-type transport system substrate-binding protein